MNNLQLSGLDLRAHPCVITLCDYELCPTIKSNNGSKLVIVVKSDGNSQSIKARSLHRGVDLRSLENSAIGGIAQ
jgi:hypothetical protein